MKIGISFSPAGKAYGRYGKDKFSKVRQHGYSAVDYNIANTDIDLYNLNENDLRLAIHAEKTSAQASGVEIFQVHGPWRWPPRDGSEQERSERLEKMKKAVVITALLGCENLVVHPIMPFGIEDLESKKERETRDLNVVFFKELVAWAKQHGVTVCLENMPMRNFSIGSPEKILSFVKEINDDNFKICLDTGHVAIFPELTVGNEVRRLGSYIKTLHIHDNMGDRDSHLYPGKGIINWNDFIAALGEIGYNGVLSLETLPSSALEDDAFERESRALCKTFAELVSSGQTNKV